MSFPPKVATTREMIADLHETLTISNIEWSEWEEEFIEDMHEKVMKFRPNFSPSQREKITELWERL